jgi:uncharacterized protein
MSDVVGVQTQLCGDRVRMQWDIRIPLRDDLFLSATLYVPRHQEAPAPAIVTITPYIRQVHHKEGVYFAAHGFPFLTVDVRGRGNSDGTFKANGNEANDGHDVIEWLAKQPYCNGKVGMWGKSYSGYVEWAVARELPGHLATIVPVACPYRGVDSPMRNNIFSPYRIQWLTYLSGRAAQDAIFVDQSFWRGQFKAWHESGTPFKDIDSLFGNPSPIFQEWMLHPRRDAYWDSYNPTPEQYAQISVPILSITGAYDGNQRGTLMHYREHLRNASPEGRAQHYLIIGPWDHDGTKAPKARFAGIEVGPASLIDLPKLHVEWYEWTMRAGPKPKFLQDNVAYYVMVADRWRYAESLGAITAGTESLYLQATANPTDVLHSGSLTPQPSMGGEPDCYVYDPRDTSLAELESEVGSEDLIDQRILYASAGKQLVYHSAPYDRDTEISGFFRLSVWISLDQPDTDFCASIHVIGLDGSSIQLGAHLLRARYRESAREQRLITTQQPLRYDFEHFNFVSRLIRRGHRLRLVIRPLNSIFWQKNYNSGGVVAEESMKDSRVVTVRVFHDASHPSVLYVPIGRAES